MVAQGLVCWTMSTFTQYFDQKYQGRRVDSSNPVGDQEKAVLVNRHGRTRSRKPTTYRYIVSALHIHSGKQGIDTL